MKQFYNEIIDAACYRRNPGEIVHLAKAKVMLRMRRCRSAGDLLRSVFGQASEEITSGLDRWGQEFASMWQGLCDAGEGQGGIGREDGLVLYGLTRLLKPDVIIETGIASGISSAHFGAALIENGHGRLYSVDLPKEQVPSLMTDGSKYKWQKYGHGWAIPKAIRGQLGGRHELVLGDVREVLPKLLHDCSPVDVFFHDDLHDPDHMLWEYRLAWEHLRPGGVLVSDDCNAGWIRFAEERGKLDAALANVSNLAMLRK